MRNAIAVAMLAGLWTAGAAGAVRVEEPVEVLDVAPVWAGHPVGFDLLTVGNRQFAAYYDKDRNLTVAQRTLDSTNWAYHVLPTKVGWDSHNYVTLAADRDGFLHLSGNMHVTPLIYFRTSRPLDASSFERVPSMVGDREKRATYPIFLRGPSGEMIFMYRDGSSGNGNQIFNVYDEKTRAWKRLLDEPFTDGEGLMNAYLRGPLKGPDGWFHMCWVWRDTGDCATNHDLCYARSRDLVRWERSDGTPLTLPIRLKTAEIVDPVPAGGGIINGNTAIGFDAGKRVVLTYHKYDAAGNTQLYQARLEGGRWAIRQATDWTYRWEFKGGGTIGFEIGFGPVTAEPDGRLMQSVSHVKLGSGMWRVDPDTLRLVEKIRPAAAAKGVKAVKLPPPREGMSTKGAWDMEPDAAGDVRYSLRWDTLPANRDAPRPPPWPDPSTLRLVKYLRVDAARP